jgi:hypothetical protein
MPATMVQALTRQIKRHFFKLGSTCAGVVNVFMMVCGRWQRQMKKMSSKADAGGSYRLQFSLKKKYCKFIFNEIELFVVFLNISNHP